MRVFFPIFLVILGTTAWAAKKSSGPLAAIESRYRNSTSVLMQVEKTVKIKLLDKTTASSGKIYISPGKFRWDTEVPEKSMVLMKGNQVWMVDYPAQSEEAVRVLKAKNFKKTKPHALIAFLMGQGRLSDNYSVAQEEDVSGVKKLHLKPKQADDQLVSVIIQLATGKKSEISKITFEDTLGSTTELVFTEVQFNKPLKKGLFKFEQPKNSVVTELQ